MPLDSSVGLLSVIFIFPVEVLRTQLGIITLGSLVVAWLPIKFSPRNTGLGAFDFGRYRSIIKDFSPFASATVIFICRRIAFPPRASSEASTTSKTSFAGRGGISP